MAENMTERPSKRRPLAKIRHQMAALGMEFPRRWTSGTISTNLDVIWGMSPKCISARIPVSPTALSYSKCTKTVILISCAENSYRVNFLANKHG